MKKGIIVLSCALLVAGGVVGYVIANGQETEPKKSMGIDECVRIVKSLQGGDEASREKAFAELKKSDRWTLLDEIGNPDVDEKDQYMTLELNAMAYEVASSNLEDYGNPQGVFVDGRDPDYDVCFIEKCIAAGQEVVYELKDRSGDEEIAVVEMEDEDLDVWLDGTQLQAKQRVFKGKCRGEVIKLRLKNRRGKTVSFVIINEH